MKNLNNKKVSTLDAFVKGFICFSSVITMQLLYNYCMITMDLNLDQIRVLAPLIDDLYATYRQAELLGNTFEYGKALEAYLECKQKIIHHSSIINGLRGLTNILIWALPVTWLFSAACFVMLINRGLK